MTLPTFSSSSEWCCKVSLGSSVRKMKSLVEVLKMFEVARHCVKRIRARLSEEISLDELAAEAQFPTFHFAHKFK